MSTLRTGLICKWLIRYLNFKNAVRQRNQLTPVINSLNPPATMKPIEYWLNKNRRRITFGHFLNRASTSLSAFLFLFGAVILGIRLVKPDWWPRVLWLGFLEVPMLLAAWWYATIKRPKPAEADAILDRRLGTGGLLMTLRETGEAASPGEWSASINKTPLEWSNALFPLPWLRCSKTLVLPILFALGTCMIPGRSNGRVPVLRNSVARAATGELQSMLQQLLKSQLVDSARAGELQNTIQQLIAESESQPLTHEKWGVIDSIRDVMKTELDSSSLSASKALSVLQSLQQSLKQSGFDPSQLENGQFPTELLSNLTERDAKQLSTTVAGITQMLIRNNNDGLPDEIKKLLNEMTTGGQIQLPQDMASQFALLNSLRELLQNENQLLSGIRKELSASDQSWAGLGTSLLSDMLGGNDPANPSNQTGMQSMINSIFGGESKKQEQEFDQVEVAAPDRERDLSLPQTAPDVSDNDDAVVRSDPREFENSEGNERWSRKLRPRHRKVVERYFSTGR